MRDALTMAMHSHAISEHDHPLHDDVQRCEQWTTRWPTQAEEGPQWGKFLFTLLLAAIFCVLALSWFEML